MELYLEEVKDELLELLSKKRYWSETEKTSDQIRTVKDAQFLNSNLIQSIEDHLFSFRGDVWKLACELAEICDKHLMKFPSPHVFAVFVQYLFYRGDVRKLL